MQLVPLQREEPAISVVCYPSNTTHFLALLDQIFRVYHIEHDKALDATLDLLKLHTEVAVETQMARQAALSGESKATKAVLARDTAPGGAEDADAEGEEAHIAYTAGVFCFFFFFFSLV